MMAGPFTEVIYDEDSQEPGIHLDKLGMAIGHWAWMQEQQQSVASAALTFNTTPQIVRDAIEAYPWTLLTGPTDDPTKQMIEHDGE